MWYKEIGCQDESVQQVHLQIVSKTMLTKLGENVF